MSIKKHENLTIKRSATTTNDAHKCPPEDETQHEEVNKNIKIKTNGELNRLLSALALEIIVANTSHSLYCNLVDSISEYEEEINQSPVFWRIALDSLNETRLLRMSRIFDQNASSLNLANLLKAIRSNKNLFEEDEFKKRMENNPHVENLAKKPRLPNISELENDLVFAREKNDIVRRLVIWRNNIIAHRGLKTTLGKIKILEDNPITKEEIDYLLENAIIIVNKYSSLFNASIWSKFVIGQDDYMNCLKLIRKGVAIAKIMN